MAKKLLLIIYAMLMNGKEYDDGDKLLTMRKLERMKLRTTPIPTSSCISKIDGLKERSISSEVYNALMSKV